jgi:hypothetical protein
MDEDQAKSAEEAMEQELEELIDAAMSRPITREERTVLRWHCGLRT